MHLTHELTLCIQITGGRVDCNGDSKVSSVKTATFWPRYSSICIRIFLKRFGHFHGSTRLSTLLVINCLWQSHPAKCYHIWPWGQLRRDSLLDHTFRWKYFEQMSSSWLPRTFFCSARHHLFGRSLEWCSLGCLMWRKISPPGLLKKLQKQKGRHISKKEEEKAFWPPLWPFARLQSWT